MMKASKEHFSWKSTSQWLCAHAHSWYQSFSISSLWRESNSSWCLEATLLCYQRATSRKASKRSIFGRGPFSNNGIPSCSSNAQRSHERLVPREAKNQTSACFAVTEQRELSSQIIFHSKQIFIRKALHMESSCRKLRVRKLRVQDRTLGEGGGEVWARAPSLNTKLWCPSWKRKLRTPSFPWKFNYGQR